MRCRPQCIYRIGWPRNSGQGECGRVLDFTSSLYLGFGHAWRDLPPWLQLTQGKPAALEELEGNAKVESELASLTGCEAAGLGSSTLHLFWDLFGMLSEASSSIFLDEGSYPIARWGVERAAGMGASVRTFSMHDFRALRSAIVGRKRPVVVTDGFCPAKGKAAPIEEYAECAARQGGLVVVDDTQALGIFGRSPDEFPPYGQGGGGSLWGIGRRENVLVVSSLAKAIGVPVAMLGGSARLVAAFRERSETRVYCSPPSAATLAAARQALDLNRRFGDALRARLAERVEQFRNGLARLRLPLVHGCFPVQPVYLPPSIRAEQAHQALLRRGVKAVLHGGAVPRLSFVFTVRHQRADIEYALEALEGTVRSAAA
jgi:8-amino-7-oxononanoate synthase